MNNNDYTDTLLRFARELLTPEQLEVLAANDVPLYGVGGLRHYLGSISIAAFTKLYFYDDFYLDFPAVHLDMIRDLQEIRDRAVAGSQGLKLVRAVPRGHAKSTYFSRILPLHGFLFDWSSHTILLGANDTAARDKLGKIINDIETNEAILQDFPDLKGKVFGATRIENRLGHAVAAYGSGSNAIRGLSNPTRPTLVIGDDLDSDEMSYSEDQSMKAIDWWNRTVLPVGTPEDTTSYILIGTVISKNTLIYDTLDSSIFDAATKSAVVRFSPNQDLWLEWEKYFLKEQPKSREDDAFYQENMAALLMDTEVLWNTRKTDYYALMVQKFNNRRAFFSESQNMPEEAGSKLGKVHYVSMPENLQDWLLLGSLDPTAKGGKNNDYSAWVEVLFNPKTKIMIATYADVKQRSYEETVSAVSQRILSSSKRYDGIYVEANSIGTIIASEIEKIIAANHYRVTQVNNKLPKQERIDILSLYIPREQLVFVSDIEPLLLKQIDGFPHIKHDDAIDSLALLVMELRNRRMLDIQSG